MNENILAIIPARSGSKGLPHKNIKKLQGKPLLAYSIEAALQSEIFTDIILSTDSTEYAAIGREYGATVPFLRQKDLASDQAKIADVILDILDKASKSYDYFMLLQPTSPLRTSKDIIQAYELLAEKKASSVVSVCKAEHSPLWMNNLPADLSLANFLPVEHKNRQELQDFYRLNGAIYLCSVASYLQTKSFYGKKSFAYIMDSLHSIDIDSELDFITAESVLRHLTNK